MARRPFRILVATDYSDEAHHALTFALGWAARSRGVVHVLHVVESERGHDESPRLMHHLTELEREMEAGRHDAGASKAPLERHIAVGEPVAEILRVAAQDDVDLIVLGTRGTTHRKRIGSVAERVVAFAPCPVLYVSGPTAHEARRGHRTHPARSNWSA